MDMNVNIILKTGMSECNAGEKFSKSTKHAEIGNLFERILLKFLNPFLSRVRRPCMRTWLRLFFSFFFFFFFFFLLFLFLF